MVGSSRTAGYRCSVCASERATFLQAYGGTRAGFSGKALVRCEGCRLVSMHPPPTEEELAAFYGSYWGERVDAKRLDKLRQRAEARARFIAAHLPERRLLSVVDVGSGLGFLFAALVDAAPGRCIEYTAVEVDPDALRRLEEMPGVASVHRRIEECPGPYDVMVMSHFLEHLRDPVGYLREHRARLAPGGLLFAEVPNADHRFKPRNEPHLAFFDVATLARALEAAGFAVVRIATCGAPIAELGRRNAEGAGPDGRDASAWRRLRRSVKRTFRSRDPRSRRPAPDPYLDAYDGDRRWIRAIATRPVDLRPAEAWRRGADGP